MSYTGFLPCSEVPVPKSLLPAPKSLLPKIYNESTSPNSKPLYYSYLELIRKVNLNKSESLAMIVFSVLNSSIVLF
ncbi:MULTISPECIES: hypothetical protein [unclassified Moorena]|uniref:hypothetical protein n=1 Tax=unclassified Moorena TaxID=2683338 RepID=UPI0013FC0529|nr:MULTISPECIES: hypothetical protein [unclassified Moorena]NEP20959.1 hypothetical protein [Moorena sp. SIO3I6]NEQ57432.1 hypothetical protein [Moorena sp. SIO4A1]